MGIESDQLVFDYLSRVGDLAQQRQLPSNTRMRLVSGLRGEIDRRRATRGEESPAAVRGILRQLGTPDELVDRAAGVDPVPGLPEPGLPEQRGRRWRRGGVPTPRPGATATSSKRPSSSGAPSPHLAGTDEVGAADTEPDWWRMEATPRPGDDLVPGFVGGVEIPELLKPPSTRTRTRTRPGTGTDGPAARRRARRAALGAPPSVGAPRRRRGRGRRARCGRGPGAAVVPRSPRLANPFLLLAALLLLGGALFGSLPALAFGWLLAWASRRLTRREVQVAVIVLPGLAATAGAVWLWGRVAGRWGQPIVEGGAAMGAALGDTWPWVVRVAAVSSALFLLWRSQRR